MSEIEKMYKNAGIEKLLYCDICKAQKHALGLCAETKCEPFCPPFTAEKQMLLLQLLAKIESADYFQFFFYEIKQEWIFRLNMLTELSCESAYIYESRNRNFDECIAGLINLLWQDLTEEEKQQVKGILE